ncbi:MAG: hypothetical protein U9Q74_10795, partial [Gemmatimonadota bacterium]|nr:hypothetical protein [Gemmatimonadota bacterium]
AVAGAGVIWKLSPQRGGEGAAAPLSPPANPAGGPAGAAAVNLDSIANVERNLQAEVAQARKIAMDAEHRADSIAAANRALASRGNAAPTAEDHAHLYVFAEGGSPQVILDGVLQRGAPPMLLQVPPGDHQIAVRGVNAFAPPETTVTLAAEDTATVIFRAHRGGLQRRGPGDAASPSGTPAIPKRGETVPGRFGEYFTRDAATGKIVPNWPVVTEKLGFDPRTTNPRSLTPQQRLAYRRFMQLVDSAKRVPQR